MRQGSRTEESLNHRYTHEGGVSQGDDKQQHPDGGARPVPQASPHKYQSHGKEKHSPWDQGHNHVVAGKGDMRRLEENQGRQRNIKGKHVEDLGRIPGESLDTPQQYPPPAENADQYEILHFDDTLLKLAGCLSGLTRLNN